MLNNDYLSCDFYQNQANQVNEEGFTTFFDETSAKYYFAYVSAATGKVIFRSEGYPTAAARKTGISSVTKNMTDEKRFSILEEANSFFVVLKAKNSVEIARSCPFSTQEAAENVINELTGKTIAETIVAPKVEKKIEEKVEKKVEKKANTATAKKVNIAAKISTDAIVFAASNDYLGHETMSDEYGKTGYALFTNVDNKHCFVVYNQDGSIFQRSFAFSTEKERNEAFIALKNAILDENSYKIVENNNAFSVQITDNAGQILSSSEAFPTFTKAFMNTPKGWAVPTEMVGTMY